MGKVVNRFKVSKHFELTIADDAFTFARLEDNIAAEAALDGLYIIRTSVTAQRMDAPTCVRSAADAPTFEVITTPNLKQQRALELIGQIKM